MGIDQLSTLNKFIVVRWAYSVGEMLVSNEEYTQLLDTVKVTNPDSEYLTRSWSSDPCPVKLLEAIGRCDLIHNVILSDKTESIPSLNTDLEVRNELCNVMSKGTLSMKHDGWNIQANYFRGLRVNISTRGRSSDAIDVSALASMFPVRIPENEPIKIVMELTCSKENYKFCRSMFGNVSERSAVSSLLARPEYYHLLSAHAFDVHGFNLEGRCKFELLKEWGFETPEYYEVYTYEDILQYLKVLSDRSYTYGFPTDGAVYDGEKRRAIRLLAWEEPIYRSYVIDYLEQFGPYRISPSVLIEPVYRKGYTQRRISMTNWQRIIDYNLQKGAPIAFRIASSATADFDEGTTRLLHEQWKGRWDEYKELIDQNEEVVRCQQLATENLLTQSVV